MDFVFRYCNKQMEVVEGIPIEEICQFVPYPVSVSLPLQESLIPKARKSPYLFYAYISV